VPTYRHPAVHKEVCANQSVSSLGVARVLQILQKVPEKQRLTKCQGKEHKTWKDTKDNLILEHTKDSEHQEMLSFSVGSYC
jgi:hypothetical protein